MTATRRLGIPSLLLWTLVVSCLRAVRLPNDFSKEHWVIDYRFGFVKRGLVGSLISLATGATRTRPTEQLIVVASGVLFVGFCAVLMAVGLRIIKSSGWSTTAIVTVLVFLSSPFIVMSAHLIGYFDNIVIVLTVASLVLLLRGQIWFAAALQAVAILVHETSLLVGFPVFCLAWLLVNRNRRRTAGAVLPVWPLALPIGTFLLLVLSQSFAPPHLEDSLDAYLSGYAFLDKHLRQVRVPHWIAITLSDSYALHRGLFLGRL